MSLNRHHLRAFITDVLKRVPQFYSEYAVELMMLTAATESDLGYAMKQDGGPALGIMQVEPHTMRDNYGNYLYFRDRLTEDIGKACGVYKADEWQLECNMAYNVIMARLKYWRSPDPMPIRIEAMAEWHEKWYNTTDNHNGRDVELTLAKYWQLC